MQRLIDRLDALTHWLDRWTLRLLLLVLLAHLVLVLWVLAFHP